MKFDVLFRLDAGEGIGLGHLRRCLALACSLKDSGLKKIAFVTRTQSSLTGWVGKDFPIYELKSQSLGEEIEEWKKLFLKISSRWVIIDWYEATPVYLEKLKFFVPTLLCVDDNAGLKDYPVDGIINHNVYAESLKYKTLPEASLFLGPKYALIGKEFTQLKRKAAKKNSIPKLFVSLGGFSRESHFQKIKTAVEALNGKLETFWVTGNQKSVSSQMSQSYLAITGSGTTTYELAYLGVPMLLVIMAQNQMRIAQTLDKAGVAKNLGWLKDLSYSSIAKEVNDLLSDSKLRAKMSARGQSLIDGQGAMRLSKDLIRTYILRKGK